jgi:hypothetical protein
MSFIAQEGSLNATGWGRNLERAQLPQYVSFLFKQTADSFGMVMGCAVQDSDGAIYVGGMNRTNNGSFLAIWKFAPNGSIAWSRRYIDVIQEEYRGIEIDATYVYVSRTNSNNIERYLKSNGSPDATWANTSQDYDNLVRLPDGIYYLSGSYIQQVPSTMTGTTTRFNFGYNNSYEFKLGNDGFLYLNGEEGYSPYYTNVQKVNTSTKQIVGNVLRIGNSTAGAGEGFRFSKCVVDSSGNCYVATRYSLDGATNTLVLLKINPTGPSIIWKKKYTINSFPVQFYVRGNPFDIAMSDDNKLFIGSASEYNGENHFLQINTDDGSVIWNRTFTYSGGSGANSRMRLMTSGRTLTAVIGGIFGPIMAIFRMLVGSTAVTSYVLNGTTVTVTAPAVTVANDTSVTTLLTSTSYFPSTATSGAAASNPSTTNNTQYVGPFTATLT